jgi:hypothetical protein
MRKKNPIARVATVKAVITATEWANVRIEIDMTIRLKKDGTPLIEIACTCGAAPCQILALNHTRTETEFLELDSFLVPVHLDHLVNR